MKTTFKKELPVIVIALLPLIYLLFIWSALPDKVPLHWNIDGEIDRYGSKTELIIIPFLLPFLTYGIFVVVPKIDPKGKLGNMGNKLQNLKVLLTTFMSVLAIYILYSAKEQTLSNPGVVVIAVGILYLILGNYFKTIKPNYFIGIRTPWTLENEMNWRATHRLASKLWFGGGLAIVILSLIVNAKLSFTIFLAVTVTIVIIPLVYSYLLYRKEKKAA